MCVFHPVVDMSNSEEHSADLHSSYWMLKLKHNVKRKKCKHNLLMLFASTYMVLMVCDDFLSFLTFLFNLKQKNVKIKFVDSYI